MTTKPNSFTTKTASRNGYTFTRDGSVTLVTDSQQSGTEVYWSDSRRAWVFVDHSSHEVRYANEIAAIRPGEGEDWSEIAPAPFAWACDLDGRGLIVIDAGGLDLFPDSEIVFDESKSHQSSPAVESRSVVGGQAAPLPACEQRRKYPGRELPPVHGLTPRQAEKSE